MRGSTIFGRASFERNGLILSYPMDLLILSYPMDLLLSIIEIYFPTSRTVMERGGGGYKKAVIRV